MEDFLDNPDMVAKIKNKRIFYIVEPELEKGKYLKFGIAGVNTGRGVARLKEYDITYGRYAKGKDTNYCTGVYLWAIYPFQYNRLVEPKNSKPAKLELKLKRECKQGFRGSDGKTAKCGQEQDFRGSERISGIKASDLIKKVNSLLAGGAVDDEATNINRDAREPTKKFRKDKAPYKGGEEGAATDEESAEEKEEEATENARDLRAKAREAKQKKPATTPKTEPKKAATDKKERARTIETRSVSKAKVQTRASSKK